jgi:2-polyprenyl-3-methyl-5-hydroxy-6-metoxy-1,4-benzoquinol methylase
VKTDSIVDYKSKPESYFQGCREDYVTALPDNPGASILEVGCAYGATGQLALERGKCSRYVGIDINPDVSDIAGERLSEVIIGNVEEMSIDFQSNSFDALILSEVLEHLVDPWAVVKSLGTFVKPGGLVLASSPNISHYSVILNLLKGQWRLTDKGVMDRTHLRWFVPELYCELFERAGFAIDDVGPIVPFGHRTRILNAVTGNKFKHCFMRQISIRGHKI